MPSLMRFGHDSHKQNGVSVSSTVLQTPLGLDGFDPRRVFRNLGTAAALRRGDPPLGGVAGRRRPPARDHHAAHRPLPAGQVHRRRGVHARRDLVGQRQPADERGVVRRHRARPAGVSAGTRCLRAGLPGGRRCGLLPPGAGRHGAGLAQPVRPHDAHSGNRLADRCRARVHGHRRPGLPCEPARHGTRSDVCIAVHLARRLVLIGGTATPARSRSRSSRC